VLRDIDFLSKLLLICIIYETTGETVVHSDIVKYLLPLSSIGHYNNLLSMEVEYSNSLQMFSSAHERAARINADFGSLIRRTIDCHGQKYMNKDSEPLFSITAPKTFTKFIKQKMTSQAPDYPDWDAHS
jgi:hypothetical protein